MKGRWLGVCLLVAFSHGCSRKKPPTDDPHVVARVNGEVISLSAFERELSRELQSLDPSSAKTPEQTEPFKQLLVQTLVERTLLLQAARKHQLDVTTEEVDRRILRMRADFPADGFEDMLAQNQISLAELKRQTADQLLIEKLFEQQVYPRVAVTEADLRTWFEAHSRDFDQPEKVRASHIFVRDLNEARRIEQLARSGKKFSDLARRYSLAPEAKVGGDLGWFPRGVMPPQFDEVLFRLGAGQVSPVVETEFGYHLLLLTEKKGAKTFALDDVRARVEEKLLAERRREAQKAWVEDVRQKADIRINDDALLTVAWTPLPSSRRVESPESSP